MRTNGELLSSDLAAYDYVVEDEAGRLALTGMTINDSVFQKDTGVIYKAISPVNTVPNNQIDLSNYSSYDYVVEDEAGRLALTGMTVGDTIFVKDEGVVYIASDATTSVEKPVSTSYAGGGRIRQIISEDVTIGNSLCKDTSDGLIYKSDASNQTRANFYGFAGETGLSGTTIDIIISGISINHTGLIKGEKYYIGEPNILEVTEKTNNSTSNSSYPTVFGQTFTFSKGVNLSQFIISNVELSSASLKIEIYDSVGGTLLGTGDSEYSGNGYIGSITYTFSSGIYLDGGVEYYAKFTATSGSIARVYIYANDYILGSYYKDDLLSAGSCVFSASGYIELGGIGGITKSTLGTTQVLTGSSLSTSEIKLGGVGTRISHNFFVTYTAKTDGILHAFIANRSVTLTLTIDGAFLTTADGINGTVGYAGITIPLHKGQTFNVTYIYVTSESIKSSGVHFYSFT